MPIKTRAGTLTDDCKTIASLGCCYSGKLFAGLYRQTTMIEPGQDSAAQPKPEESSFEEDSLPPLGPPTEDEAPGDEAPADEADEAPADIPNENPKRKIRISSGEFGKRIGPLFGGLFVLYLIVSGNFVGELFSCELQKMLSNTRAHAWHLDAFSCSLSLVMMFHGTRALLPESHSGCTRSL